MSQHTPEPWSYETGKGYHEGTIVITSYTTPASSPLAHISNICDDAEPDARRIVACVNACAGIDTEWLENNGAYAVPVPSLRTLLNQRDELLAALKYHQAQTRPIQQSIDAIAKCEAEK